jgi:HSP20 family protein
MNLSLFHPAYQATAANPVDGLFENFWNSAWTRNSASTIGPRVDVYDEDKTLVVEAELPGVSKSDVSVSLERGILTIKAEKKTSREAKNKDYYFGERSFGTYERSFRVSEDIDPDSVKAHFEDGVLRLELGRKPESAGKKIEIQ